MPRVSEFKFWIGKWLNSIVGAALMRSSSILQHLFSMAVLFHPIGIMLTCLKLNPNALSISDFPTSHLQVLRGSQAG